MKRTSWILALVGLTSCVAEEAETADVVQAAKPPCPSWGCGENSPILGPFNLHELDEPTWNGTAIVPGAENEAHMRLRDYTKLGHHYLADVQVDHLVAIDPVTGATLSGTALVGGSLIVEYPAKGVLPAGTAEISISHVSNTVALWQAPAGTVETYELHYTMPNVSLTAGGPLCLNPLPVDPKTGQAYDGEGTRWGKPFEAILYTGDRYDAATKTVTASTFATSGNWFNIACAGGALAKLYLNRHTTASASPTINPSRGTRQAMLKMYTGDFCGTGTPFTQQGTSLHWTSNSGLSSLGGGTASVESMWNATGAVCLTRHRLHGLSSIDYEDMIQGGAGYTAECNKPSCLTYLGYPSFSATRTLFLTQSAALP